MMIKRGRALVFGDNIDTDQIYPGSVKQTLFSEVSWKG